MEQSKAFAMLITLVVLGLTTALLLNAWFITSFQTDIVREREQWHKNFYITQAALDTVVTHVAAHYAHVFAQCAGNNAGIDFDVSSIITQPSDVRLMVHVAQPEKRDKELLVIATLRDATHVQCTLRCLLTRKIITTEKGTRAQCDVSGFTVV